ncbi:hypothetical protein MAPG_03623 [Magnaporthiopsis poae ATCC 64411]|uniref:Zn(2)-C6 fungal-type domain-containing protein n=1 Tax=Magnaporthiopsis poae (strain ATCC 64411 / 73-15) TaxID=644358 RepID=A0A0C4DUI4_MAGP6|nr:hypothetical protein MAPG_03623 [Magnaporthiopsis poae ATCC 64411]
MVYCGKPSRGCQMCRTRRIKCDETKPTCNQCAKSRRQCPGYKDEFDLVFRNETKATERRAQKANRKALAQKQGLRPDADPAPADSQGSQALDRARDPFNNRVSVVVPSLAVSPEQHATCHFFANFVLVPHQDGSRGFMDYLVPMMKDEPSDSHLTHAFNACALASLGNKVTANGINFGERALGEYTKALAKTHVSLRDPEASKTDSVLAAVLLLGLFENITAKQMGMFAWGSHIEGAVQIVKARGRNQLRSKLGLLLFIAVRTQMIIHTLTTGKAPIYGIEWWMSDAVKSAAAASCQSINIKAGELRAEVTKLMTTLARTPENIELMLALIRRAQLIDQEAVMWLRDLPPGWRHKTVAWEDNVPGGDYSKAEVFPGRVDMYPDFWIASVTNMCRTSRLIMASIIVRCAAWVCSPVDYRTTPEYATAARTCVDVITDIIASVPYHLGWHLTRKDVIARHDLSGFACGSEEVVKGLSGYFLTWPLTCVHSQDYATDAQRAWVCGRLKYIGNELGVRYALMLSELQIRLPSMLIRRDGLVAQPYPNASNVEQLLSSARLAPPTSGYAMNPLQQREAMQKRQFEDTRADILTKATAAAGQSGQWLAQKMLAV